MIDPATFSTLALSFAGATELPHFEKKSFRVRNKIFATLDIEKKQASVKLTETDQFIFSTIDPAIIYPVANKWGAQGWTIVELTKVKKRILNEILTKAYENVASKK